MSAPADQTEQATRRELRQLRFRLAATRVRLVAVQVMTGMGMALAWLVGIFTAEMALDWLVHLPWVARACFSLPALGWSGYLIYCDVIRLLMKTPGDHAVACAVERALPQFKTRLIASIQLGAGDGPQRSALVRALIRETAAMAGTQDFRKVVKLGKLARVVKILACVLAVAGVMGFLGRSEAKLLLERALLLTTRLPSKTHIVKVECAAKIAAGEDLEINVQASGALPAAGLVVAEGGAHSGQYKLTRDLAGGGHPASGGYYHAVIHSLPESLKLRVQLGDTESDPVEVKVFSPPAVLGVHCVQNYPAYTKLPPVARPTGDLSLLAGSVLRINVTASGPVRDGVIHLAAPMGAGSDLPLKADPAKPAEAHGQIPIPKEGLSGFSLHVTDPDGITSRETAVYHVDIVPDKPPLIKLIHPGPSEVATASATELIAFHAEDDYGISTVRLHYSVGGGVEKTIEFDLGNAMPRQVDRRFDWKLASLKLAPGGLVDYWMEAIDANNVTGPGTSATEKAEIKIVTEDEKRAEMTERMNDALGTLDEMSQSEDDLSRQLGNRIFQKPKQP